MENLRQEIHAKSLEIKNKIKDLNNILSKLYNSERDKQSKNVYFVRSSVSKVAAASKYLRNLDTKVKKDDAREDDIEDNISKLHKATVKNVLLLEEFYKSKLRKEIEKENSQNFKNIKQNLDSVRLAQKELKRLDPDMNLNSKDWRELANNLGKEL